VNRTQGLFRFVAKGEDQVQRLERLLHLGRGDALFEVRGGAAPCGRREEHGVLVEGDLDRVARRIDEIQGG